MWTMRSKACHWGCRQVRSVAWERRGACRSRECHKWAKAWRLSKASEIDRSHHLTRLKMQPHFFDFLQVRALKSQHWLQPHPCVGWRVGMSTFPQSFIFYNRGYWDKVGQWQARCLTFSPLAITPSNSAPRVIMLTQPTWADGRRKLPPH